MAQAIKPRHEGEYLQARLFWLWACRLFQPHTAVNRVGFELNDAKSFDDVVVRYREPVPDGIGGTTTVDYMQVKHHATHRGSVTAESLVDPAFIGATSKSLLQKVLDVQRQHAPDGTGCRFMLNQPWPIDPGDALSKLVDRDNGHFRLNVLFDGTTPASEMGKVRKAWREHLNVTDEELRLVLTPLRLLVDPRTVEQMRDQLNEALVMAGLKPVDARAQIHPYDDLAWKLSAATSRVEFDRAEVEVLMRREGLYEGLPLVRQDARRLGVRSFAPFAMRLEEETDALFCALEHFDGRLIRDRTLWRERVYPDLVNFLQQHVQPGSLHHVMLEAHGTLAFATGYAVARSQARVVPMFNRVPWEPSNAPSAPHTPAWTFDQHPGGKGNATAVAISVAQHVLGDVQAYIERTGLEVGSVIEATVVPQPGRDSVRDADHAFVLARDLAQHLRLLRPSLPRGSRLLLFASVPNPLMFFLGVQAYALGPVELYEFDPNDSDYHPALRLP
ncbi:SAVED domain-containing protein [Deinococcus ruber]|uniref:SMODS-associated and fused to various effectors domain-containing protein n=1 Tax=Deinococcus ruber TaxID=1848197 RepID=A0A918FCE6_9DEIO|nr:SAVED domain-containing protein [Deinococcus ruber]GGR30368.1 hypothetical protein GCM10008957_46460 [Deinococcus ruber]